ncbi:conserved hypothetical protein, partial [Trichinella spiralis]|uniref:hypothetical protein n=1 Tax=Trichinella spiralis TaxID=6334 RepID=UPI0001EFE66D
PHSWATCQHSCKKPLPYCSSDLHLQCSSRSFSAGKDLISSVRVRCIGIESVSSPLPVGIFASPTFGPPSRSRTSDLWIERLKQSCRPRVRENSKKLIICKERLNRLFEELDQLCVGPVEVLEIEDRETLPGDRRSSGGVRIKP